MQHFRVELHAVQAAGFVFGCGNGAVGGMGHDFKTGCSCFNVIVMAHPAYVLVRQTSKHRACGVQVNQGFAVFALRSLAYVAAQHMHHQLAAVADTQHGNAPGIDFRVDGRGIFQIRAVGAAGEDNAFGILGFDFFQALFIGNDFAVNAAFAHASSNKLVVLAAEVDNQHHFLFFVLHAYCHSPLNLSYVKK